MSELLNSPPNHRLQQHVDNVRKDLLCLGKPAFLRGTTSDRPEILMLYLGVCVGTARRDERPLPDETRELKTTFGKRTLDMIQLSRGEVVNGYAMPCCNWAEPRFVRFTDPIPQKRKNYHGQPILIEDGGDIVGVMKSYIEPTVLGLADRANEGIFPGVISVPQNQAELVRVATTISEGDKPAIVNLEDIQALFGDILTIRMSSFALDEEIIEDFNKALKLPESDPHLLMSIKTMKKRAKYLASRTRSTRVSIEKLEQILERPALYD